jgi:DnaJ-class molecular chaperone
MTCPELKVCEKCGGKGFIPTGERWGPNLVWVKRCMDCCKHNGSEVHVRNA